MKHERLEEKVRKTVQEKERKRIAEAEMDMKDRSGVTEEPATPSAPPIGGAVTAIKGMSRKLKQLPNPFRNTAPGSILPGLADQGETVDTTTPEGGKRPSTGR